LSHPVAAAFAFALASFVAFFGIAPGFALLELLAMGFVLAAYFW
jgi:hypothetical protein